MFTLKVNGKDLFLISNFAFCDQGAYNENIMGETIFWG